MLENLNLKPIKELKNNSNKEKKLKSLAKKLDYTTYSSRPKRNPRKIRTLKQQSSKMKDNPKPKKIVPEPTKEDIEFDNHEIDWHFINPIDSEEEHLFEIISNNQIEIELNE